MLFDFLKALHLIFIVTWFAGLFYIVRLFIYHAEAEKRPGDEKNILQKQYKLMERRLWYGITWPSMVVTIVLGSWMAFDRYGMNVPSWLLLKLAFVLALVLYHLKCHGIFIQFQNDVLRWSSMKLRIWNEGATLLLVAIMFIVALKHLFNIWWGLIGIALFAALLLLAIRLYRKAREK